MAWTMDGRFRTPDNAVVVAFLEREQPSAHHDVASALTASAKGLTDVKWYCPDVHAYAWMVLHTMRNTIFGIAHGMRTLAYRLPAASIAEALAAGGELDPELGGGWFRFEPWPTDRPLAVTSAALARWCKVSHDYAVGEAPPLSPSGDTNPSRTRRREA